MGWWALAVRDWVGQPVNPAAVLYWAVGLYAHAMDSVRGVSAPVRLVAYRAKVRFAYFNPVGHVVFLNKPRPRERQAGFIFPYAMEF